MREMEKKKREGIDVFWGEEGSNLVRQKQNHRKPGGLIAEINC
jgi:hypothetical protein